MKSHYFRSYGEIYEEEQLYKRIEKLEFEMQQLTKKLELLTEETLRMGLPKSLKGKDNA